MNLSTVKWAQLCCHSNETRAPIANPPNTTELEGTPYHSPTQIGSPCSAVGMRTDRRTDGRDQYTFRLGYTSRELQQHAVIIMYTALK